MHALMLSVAKYACTAAICGCTAAIYGRNAAISDSGEGGAEAKKIFMDRNDLSGWALACSARGGTEIARACAAVNARY
eukprot:2280918-Rhodomonas_salina.1